MRVNISGLVAILPLMLSLAVAGCESSVSAIPDSRTSDLGVLTYRAVDRIVAATPEVPRDAPLVVTSLSDVQNLDQSSALGNLVADMARTRLVQDGYATSEIRLRNAVSLQKNEGEFLLSRNQKAILPPQNAAIILTGTYSATPVKVYISLKFIAVTNGRIISAVDYVVPYDEVAGLLSPRNT
ncbi:FlgO family outer membrane protein [Rhodopila sp.]|uniref:FlgO family outer membrane protein n=1 Tax=Rhodopila sp. TaxID=2480087 RepID=UPI003D0EA16C